MTGYILNLKLPSAINAIKVSGFKLGTKEADVVVGIAIAISSLVTLVILAIGVVLLVMCLVVTVFINKFVKVDNYEM